MMTTHGILGLVAPGLFALLVSGCESTSSNAPPITTLFIRAGNREHTNVQMLIEGRSLLLNRCIQCHALPDTAKYSPSRLREILGTMSGRANLTAREHEAVVKYLLAARSL